MCLTDEPSADELEQTILENIEDLILQSERNESQVTTVKTLITQLEQLNELDSTVPKTIVDETKQVFQSVQTVLEEESQYDSIDTQKLIDTRLNFEHYVEDGTTK
jgi:MFS superfamily sulfate permease-like transporter